MEIVLEITVWGKVSSKYIRVMNNKSYYNVIKILMEIVIM